VIADRRGFIIDLISVMKELSVELISAESFERELEGFSLAPDVARE